MRLSLNFLKSNIVFSTKFVDSSIDDKHCFFNELKNIASKNLSTAHSIFKVSSCRTILSLSEEEKFQILSNENFISGFSVYKNFDTAIVKDNIITGKKHWITNLEQAQFVIMQLKDTQGELKLFFVELPLQNETFSYNKDFTTINTPGLKDTCTGNLNFNFHPAEFIFKKDDPKYFISNNHNSLCFITNYLGSSQGLLDYLDKKSTSTFRSTYKNLSNLLDREIEKTSNIKKSSEEFWHSRNALYLDSKHLLVELCKHILTDYAGQFYNLNLSQGQHFFDCLTYSGHNGPISTSYQQLFTEPQDY